MNKKEDKNKQLKKLNKLNEIIKKCGTLHQEERKNEYTLEKNVKKGYELAYHLMVEAFKNRNRKEFEDIFHLSSGLIPSNSKQDSKFLDRLKTVYKNSFNCKVVELVSEHHDFVLEPKVKEIKKVYKKSGSAAEKARTWERLCTICGAYPRRYARELKNLSDWQQNQYGNK